jgi:AcrR family transcriptional regulator
MMYSHFPSKEELFVECMMAAAERYMVGTLKHLKPWSADPAVALFDCGKSFLSFICSPEQLEVRRLAIAEAAHSSTGRLFFDKVAVCGRTCRHSCPHRWHPFGMGAVFVLAFCARTPEVTSDFDRSADFATYQFVLNAVRGPQIPRGRARACGRSGSFCRWRA